jgi:hypothetical protein
VDTLCQKIDATRTKDSQYEATALSNGEGGAPKVRKGLVLCYAVFRAPLS